MSDLMTHAAAQRYARIGGVLYLVVIVNALFAEAFVRGRLVVPGDVAATAANILGSQALYRAGLAADVVDCALDIAIAVILFVLLRPVSRSLALLAALYRIAAATVLGVAGLMHQAALTILSGRDFLDSFTPQQLQGLAYLALKLHGIGYNISLLFFGAGCCVLGRLVFRSAYLPRAIGALLAFSGACYLLHGLAAIAAPAVSALLFPWTLLPGFLSELTLCVWLLSRGVDAAKWHQATPE